MNTLYIDTSNNKKITVGLEVDGTKDMIEKETNMWKAQIVLPMIQELLKKHNLRLQHIQKISLHPGPGSFTGLRVGAAIANTLGAWLKIPINGKKAGEIVEPVYQ